MIYTPYSEQSVYKTVLSLKPDEKHFIFALDGSSSMRGRPWKDLMKELKIILQDLAKDSENRVSILVFSK
jgi:5-enolpyruvylshikimate-3-phosphate synthase